MTTLKELAKLLNISVSTVSKALNDSHEISENTKRRVNELAEKLNYKPNRIAQQLKNNKTKTAIFASHIIIQVNFDFNSQYLFP